MYHFLLFAIIGFFLALLFLNIYFRIKVLKHYKYLVSNRVEFQVKDLFNKHKIETEIIPQYPKHANEIRAFILNIKNSVKIAAGIVLLIALLGVFINAL